MQLSGFTDYALRVLVFVGLQRNRRVSITEVAEAYDISRNHVVKVVHRLQAAGYLATFRGRGGGIELAMSPGDIPLGAVVREFENLELVECFRPGGACAIQGACRLQGALGEARDAFLAALDRYTLASLLRPRSKLERLLALG